MAAGNDVSVQYNLERAGVIVCLDADFFGCGAGHLRYSRQFAARRRPEGAGCRLYAAETMPSTTGAKADHRLPLKPSQIELLARALAADLGIAGVNRGGALPANAQAWVGAVRDDLNAHRGSGIVVAGEGQPPVVHALAHAMNAALGNAGQTVLYTDPVEPHPVDQVQSIRELTAAMGAGQVDTLLIIGGNPVYTAPADLQFGDQMSKVRMRVHLSLHANETSAISHWQIPEAHFLEAWSDARAFDGTVSIVQPLIAPLYGGRSAHEVLATLSDRPERTGYQIVREYWMRRMGRRVQSVQRVQQAQCDRCGARLPHAVRTRCTYRTRCTCRTRRLRNVLAADRARRRDGEHCPADPNNGSGSYFRVQRAARGRGWRRRDRVPARSDDLRRPVQ